MVKLQVTLDDNPFNSRYQIQQHRNIWITSLDNPNIEVLGNSTMTSCCENQSIQDLTTCVAGVASVYAATWS